MEIQMPRGFKALLLLMILVFVVSACGGDEEDEPTPTPRPDFPTITPINSPIPQVASPTPLPTFDFGPSPTPFAGFPTAQVPPVAQANIQIVSPTTGSTLRGYVSIFGSASHPDFVQYALEYGPEPNGSNLWYPITPQA